MKGRSGSGGSAATGLRPGPSPSLAFAFAQALGGLASLVLCEAALPFPSFCFVATADRPRFPGNMDTSSSCQARSCETKRGPKDKLRFARGSMAVNFPGGEGAACNKRSKVTPEQASARARALHLAYSSHSREVRGMRVNYKTEATSKHSKEAAA